MCKYLDMFVCLFWLFARFYQMRGHYRKFDPNNPNCQQEITDDADKGKSNLTPFDHVHWWSSKGVQAGANNI